VCEACGKRVDDGKTEVVVKALGKSWHKGCFSCSQCKAMLPSSFHAQDLLPYCDLCYAKICKDKCAKCHQALVGTFVKAFGALWHKECFVCAKCERPFADGQYEIGDGKPFHAGC